MKSPANNDINILPFYYDVKSQRHRVWADYGGEVYGLATPAQKLPPFQIQRPTNANVSVTIEVYNINDVFVIDLTDAFNLADFEVIRYGSDGFDIMQYRGVMTLKDRLPEGMYYLKITDVDTTYYSEIFNAINSDFDKYTCVEYGDYQNYEFPHTVGSIDYSNQFKFRLYVRQDLGFPKIEYTENIEDRNGISFYEKQITEITRGVTFQAPDWLVVALRLLPLCDVITVKHRGETYNVNLVNVESTPLPGAIFASTELEFQTNTPLVKVGNGQPITGAGAYNQSYNDSYDNVTP